jgi:hypothetical protein
MTEAQIWGFSFIAITFALLALSKWSRNRAWELEEAERNRQGIRTVIVHKGHGCIPGVGYYESIPGFKQNNVPGGDITK